MKGFKGLLSLIQARENNLISLNEIETGKFIITFKSFTGIFY